MNFSPAYFIRRINPALLRSPREAPETVHAYADLGFDALIFNPTVAHIDQLDRLADAIE